MFFEASRSFGLGGGGGEGVYPAPQEKRHGVTQERKKKNCEKDLSDEYRPDRPDEGTASAGQPLYAIQSHPVLRRPGNRTPEFRSASLSGSNRRGPPPEGPERLGRSGTRFPYVPSERNVVPTSGPAKMEEPVRERCIPPPPHPTPIPHTANQTPSRRDSQLSPLEEGVRDNADF